MSEAVIQVTDLHKTYRDGLFRRKDVPALQGVSFTVHPGEIFGLLGPNGAGKTTLIKVLLGIVRKTSGSASVLGEPTGHRATRSRIGYLPENHRIPRHLTGLTALEFYGSLSGLSMSEIRKRRPELLETVGLGDWGHTPVGKYSKGMQQRLGLAQAMLHDPDLIILDEPTDGVDPVGRSDIRVVLKQLQAQGKTVFLNSHLLQEVELVSDRVAILDHGRVRRVAGIKELTHDETEVEFALQGPEETVREALGTFRVIGFVPDSTGHVRATVKLDAPEQIDAVVDNVRTNGVGIRSIGKRRSSLEEAFIQIIQSEHDIPDANPMGPDASLNSPESDLEQPPESGDADTPDGPESAPVRRDDSSRSTGEEAEG